MVDVGDKVPSTLYNGLKATLSDEALQGLGLLSHDLIRYFRGVCEISHTYQDVETIRVKMSGLWFNLDEVTILTREEHPEEYL